MEDEDCNNTEQASSTEALLKNEQDGCRNSNMFKVTLTSENMQSSNLQSPDLNDANNHIIAKRSLSASCVLCRICYEDNSLEKFMSPCRCSGTMGVLHRTCIEKWLSTSNNSKCEICDFEFKIEKHPKSLRQWFLSPTDPNDRRNFMGDLSCFFFLTPLAGISVWLCVQGAVLYSRYTNRTWETAGLVVLCVLLFVMYIVWIIIAVRWHRQVIMFWREKNVDIHVLDLESKDDESKTCAEIPLHVLSNDVNNEQFQNEPHRTGSEPLQSSQHNRWYLPPAIDTSIPRLISVHTSDQNLPQPEAHNDLVLGANPATNKNSVQSYKQHMTKKENARGISHASSLPSLLEEGFCHRTNATKEDRLEENIATTNMENYAPSTDGFLDCDIDNNNI